MEYKNRLGFALGALFIGICLFFSDTVAHFVWKDSGLSTANMEQVSWPDNEPTLFEKRAEYVHHSAESLQANLQTNKPAKTTANLVNKLSADAISSMLETHRSFFDRCYAKFLRQAKPKKGRVELTFSIAKTGRVEHAQVLDSSLKDTQLHRCLTAVVERVRFTDDENRKPLQVQYPIYFE